MPTESALAALNILRDGNQFQWYIVPLFAFTVYIYAVEIERRNWDLVFAGLAFWGMDWFNEIWNALVFHFTNYAPVWAAPDNTAYLILIGLNIEICFMFAVAGIGFGKMLPPKDVKILGLSNRLFIAILSSIFCVVVEIWLNNIQALTWDYWWWSPTYPWLIFLIGYLPFFLVSFWVYDMKHIYHKKLVVGSIFGFDIVCLIIFGLFLGWL